MGARQRMHENQCRGADMGCMSGMRAPVPGGDVPCGEATYFPLRRVDVEAHTAAVRSPEEASETWHKFTFTCLHLHLHRDAVAHMAHMHIYIYTGMLSGVAQARIDVLLGTVGCYEHSLHGCYEHSLHHLMVS